MRRRKLMLEHVTIGPVPTFDAIHADGRDAKSSAIATIEQTIEERRAIDVWYAPPIDGTVRTDEGDASSIADRRVFVQW
jgi:hypothetical protein